MDTYKLLGSYVETVGLKKILILCIDRDDDIGRKLGVKGPIIGVDRNKEVAVKLALADPEESDVNAIFGALNAYKELKELEGDKVEVEVATITGHKDRGLMADREVRRQLESVLSKFPANGVILVSDGVDDEQVIPVIQSRIPIISVRRVIVQQSKGIEETYFILLRYIKTALSDPKTARLFLGIPGLLLTVFSVLYLLGLIKYAWATLALIIGLLMLGKAVQTTLTTVKGGVRLAPFTVVAGLLVIALGFVHAYQKVLPLLFSGVSLIMLLTRFFQSCIGLVTLGIIIALSGRLIESYAARDPVFFELLMLATTVAVLYPVVYFACDFILGNPRALMNALLSILLGMLTCVPIFIATQKAGRAWKSS